MHRRGRRSHLFDEHGVIMHRRPPPVRCSDMAKMRNKTATMRTPTGDIEHSTQRSIAHTAARQSSLRGTGAAAEVKYYSQNFEWPITYRHGITGAKTTSQVHLGVVESVSAGLVVRETICRVGEGESDVSSTRGPSCGMLFSFCLFGLWCRYFVRSTLITLSLRCYTSETRTLRQRERDGGSARSIIS